MAELFLILSDCDTVDRVGAAITAGANGSPAVRQFSVSVAFLAVDNLYCFVSNRSSGLPLDLLDTLTLKFNLF